MNIEKLQKDLIDFKNYYIGGGYAAYSTEYMRDKMYDHFYSILKSHNLFDLKYNFKFDERGENVNIVSYDYVSQLALMTIERLMNEEQ